MYIGLDVHKKMSYYSMVDSQGTEVKKGRFPTTREVEIIRLKFSSTSLQKTSMRLYRTYHASLCYIWELPQPFMNSIALGVVSIDMLQSGYPYHWKGYILTKTQKEEDVILQYLSGHYN